MDQLVYGCQPPTSHAEGRRSADRVGPWLFIFNKHLRATTAKIDAAVIDDKLGPIEL